MANEELPHTQFIEVYEEMFRRTILQMFNKSIRDNYRVTGYAPMPDGKIVIRLQREFSFMTEVPDAHHS